MLLNVHSYYSYKYGTISPKDLLQLYEQSGIERPVLTDINSTSACLDFVRMAQLKGMQPAIGIDFRNGANQLFIALAKNNSGYQEMNHYLSPFLTTKHPEIPARAPRFEQVSIVYPLEKYTGFELAENEFVGVRPEHLAKLSFSNLSVAKHNLVALQTATFTNKSDFNAHRLLRSIDKNLLLSKLPKTEEGKEQHLFLTADELRMAYSAHSYLITNAENLLSECQIYFEFGDESEHKNKAVFCDSGKERDDVEMLKYLCQQGLEYRYGSKPTETVLQRVETELKIIQEKRFTSYFLMNWDMTQYARMRHYPYVGRGSGANSIVAYLLRITDVDPIELDLYFERFINLYRKNPPDFDVDFSWTDRDDVTKYLFDKHQNVALLGAYVTFQQKAVIRELGKVFGLPKREIDLLSAGEFNPKNIDKMAGLVLRYGQLIAGFPSHCSVHSSGILISQHPLSHFSATFMPPKGFATTQFDMVIAEDAGLYKFDVLSQRGLGKIKDGIDIVLENQGIAVDIHDVKSFKEDPDINNNLKVGKAIAAFYVESPAMRMLLSKLKVDTYLGLVAASSVIRPGVAQSGMMREYIQRFRDPERRKDAHPVLFKIMPETFGVMVYQEDVIKVAHYFADLTLAEADVLRRGMSGKFRSRDEFLKVKQKFFDNCHSKGYTQELTAEVWRQIESFAGYAFAKGHSASYAVESYQSLFLKTHYPLEFMVAAINNGGGFYRTEFYVHEARMLGGNIHAPCVNNGKALTSIKGKDIFIGIGFIQGLEGDVAKRIELERIHNGPFESFDDFIDRVPIGLEQTTLLVRINALRFTGRNKRELLWEAHFKLNKEKKKFRQDTLFKAEHRKFTIPELSKNPLENAFDEIELLGYPLCHPFNLLAEEPKTDLLARDMPKLKGQVIAIWGYLVTTKNTKTIKREAMNFGTFLDQDGYFFDTTHFPDVAAKYRFRGRGVYEIIGSVEEEFGFFSIEVISMRKIDMIPDPRYDDGNEKSGSIANFIR
ncbi:MAG: DNA polymerase III subunit alpha [Bacteroidetes bacterium]|nr:DNA polymerase III subunit alpha [Bacteroidota bacterium]